MGFYGSLSWLLLLCFFGALLFRLAGSLGFGAYALGVVVCFQSGDLGLFFQIFGLCMKHHHDRMCTFYNMPVYFRISVICYLFHFAFVFYILCCIVLHILYNIVYFPHKKWHILKYTLYSKHYMSHVVYQVLFRTSYRRHTIHHVPYSMYYVLYTCFCYILYTTPHLVSSYAMPGAPTA